MTRATESEIADARAAVVQFASQWRSAQMRRDADGAAEAEAKWYAAYLRRKALEQDELLQRARPEESSMAPRVDPPRRDSAGGSR
jgi:hypothetical protein